MIFVIKNFNRDFYIKRFVIHSAKKILISGWFPKGMRTSIPTAQKTKLCIKDFFSKCDQIRSFLLIEIFDRKLHFGGVYCTMLFKK